MSVMNFVHKSIAGRIKDSKPPKIDFEYIDPNNAYITYFSERRNLTYYFLGMLNGAAKHFDDPIKYEITEEKNEENFSMMKIRVTSEKNTGKIID
ncbi:MAG TPA: heme NO-binding domain-containing protein [Tepiditoga sp.]|nr:heme NO-binding domain-containing protein [Tepiditoga sp.]